MSAVTDEAELLDLAHRAAEAAGAELLARFGSVLDVSTKSTATDPVSEADLAAETAIRRVLAAQRPGDGVLGEEGGDTATLGEGAEPTGRRWVVDPLDGTVNYLYGLTQFAVSVAVEDGDGALAGTVLAPAVGERFSATREGPARRRSGDGDELELSPGSETRLKRALVLTGFGYDPAVRRLQGRVVAELLPRVRDIRRAGAAALDLCAVAAGRGDAYYERGVKPWDIAAGALICQRVGLVVRRLEPVPAGASGPGSAELPEGIVVAPPAFVDELYGLVAGPAA